MASLRIQNVKQGGKTYTDRVMDYAYTEKVEQKRKKRNFKDRGQGKLFKAEIELKLDRTRHGELEVDMGPVNVCITR